MRVVFEFRLCCLSHRVDDFVDGDGTISPPDPNPQVQFLSLFLLLPFFLLQLNLFLPLPFHSTYFLSSLDLTLLPRFLPLPPLPPLPPLSCTVTDPSGNCFESARHFCVVAVYLCWGHRGPEPQLLSALGLEVKLPDSFTALRQKTLILDQCGFTV